MKFEGSIEFSIVEATDDRVVSEMPIRAGLKNPLGVGHVGAILWLRMWP
jgi:1,4-dihydroxy-2-naphthoyl-CoA hydrolase